MNKALTHCENSFDFIFPGEFTKPEWLEDKVPGTVFQREDGETPEKFDQRCHECHDERQLSEM